MPFVLVQIVACLVMVLLMWDVSQARMELEDRLKKLQGR